MTKTQELQEYLLRNGFTQRGKRFERSRSWERKEVTFTFLGGGWVEKYEREYPASEGWSIKKYRVSKFLGRKAMRID